MFDWIHVQWIAGGICLLLVIYAVAIEPQWFRVRRIRLKLAHSNTPRMKILHLSDTHFKHHETKRVKFLQSLKSLDADLIAFTGDMVEPHGNRNTLWEAVEGLIGRYGSFVVFGNHDYVYYTPKELFYDPGKIRHHGLKWSDMVTLSKGFQALGIQPLFNEHRVLNINGQPLLVVGIDDPYVHRDDIDKTFAEAPKNLPTLVLCHTPKQEVIERIVARGAHLILSGHTHGGQVRLFGFAPIRRCRIPQRYCRGLSRWGQAWLNVSTGIGVTTMTHIRFSCRPEAILIEIEPDDISADT